MTMRKVTAQDGVSPFTASRMFLRPEIVAHDARARVLPARFPRR